MSADGCFIVLEGPEGAGKSVQATRLAEWLRTLGHNVIQTREPGGTPTGDAIRGILLQSDHLHLASETEALLMSAARAQHVRQVIAPAIEVGAIVVCDRYVDSTYAYQGGGLGLSMDRLREIQAFATGGVLPDLRILLDLPVEVGLARRHGDVDQINRIDRAPIEFHERVRTAFLGLAEADPASWIVIDTTVSIDEVTAAIRAAVSDRCGVREASL
ncbi:MAG: dTMP kinase [Thermomicrobiales bacterium]|nr:dTMP kinase [Thermomicrobiales bacterium]MCO5225757.1 dTMP kinase [Thermomicrobiales bacterium]MCO5228006.1 dTMP kinase [Thermomicrobiales bacterium]